MPSTRRRTPRHTLYTLAAAIVAIACIGCGSAPTRTPDTPPGPRGEIIALIDGAPLTRDRLQSDLAEQAGAQALRERVLDRRLEHELRARGLVITDENIAHEQLELARSLDTLSGRELSPGLLGSIRAARGLGPRRYPRLLRRNAMLRKLVQPTTAPTAEEEQLALTIAFGPAYRIRLFVCDDQRQAAALRQRVMNALEPDRRWVFADACVSESSHPSAPRGGLIESLSPADPAYPHALTGALTSTPNGDCSPVIATQAGYALVLVESEIAAINPSAEQREHVLNQLTQRKQRLAMQRFADELVAGADVVVLDRSLNWAWSQAR